MEETRALARFVAETPFEALPPSVVEAARVYILDNLASGFAGAPQPWSEIVAGMVEGSSVGTCSLFGRARGSSPSAAALFNGVAIGGFETDHPFSAGNCHPGAAVFPATLAAAELSHLDGRSFLAAVALGYEALCRVGSAATRAVEEERGFHGPGTNAPIGGAFGAGRALRLSAETLTHAVGIAASHGSGLLEFSVEGAMTKRLHVGRGSQQGLECALLARGGFTGPSTALEGEWGFLRVYSPHPKPELLLKGLGEEWLMTGCSLKSYPCHMSFHAVVDAVHHYRQAHDLVGASIEAVSVRSTTRMMGSRFGERAPTTLMGAQYSLPWSTAVALTLDASAPATWSDAMLSDTRLQRLAASVELREEVPVLPGATAEVVVTAAGREHRIVATDWKGAPTNPYTFDDMAEKFRRYAAGQVPDGRVDEIVARVARLEAETDIAEFGALIRR